MKNPGHLDCHKYLQFVIWHFARLPPERTHSTSHYLRLVPKLYTPIQYGVIIGIERYAQPLSYLGNIPTFLERRTRLILLCAFCADGFLKREFVSAGRNAQIVQLCHIAEVLENNCLICCLEYFHVCVTNLIHVFVCYSFL